MGDVLVVIAKHRPEDIMVQMENIVANYDIPKECRMVLAEKNIDFVAENNIVFSFNEEEARDIWLRLAELGPEKMMKDFYWMRDHRDFADEIWDILFSEEVMQKIFKENP